MNIQEMAAPLLWWLAASFQTAHRRGLVIASPESQFRGWRWGRWSILSSRFFWRVPETGSWNVWNVFEKGFLFSPWNLLLYAIFLRPLRCFLALSWRRKEDLQLLGIPWALFPIPSSLFYKHREVGTALLAIAFWTCMHSRHLAQQQECDTASIRTAFFFPTDSLGNPSPNLLLKISCRTNRCWDSVKPCRNEWQYNLPC